MFPVGLLLEGMLAVLLGVTVFYCIHLDRKLRALRSGQDGLRDVIRGLNSATQTAQSSVAQLRLAGEATATDLSEVVTRARALADELSLMIEAGNSLADRLEGLRTRDQDTDAPRATTAVNGARGAVPLDSGDRLDGAALQQKLRQALKEAR